MERKPPVLVVYHDVNTARSVAEVLIGDYDVYVTKVPDRANEFLQGNPIDLIVASRDLAGMMALDWFRRLASDYPDIVRILLLPGPVQESEKSALAEGITHHLVQEPVEPVTFKQIIDGYFPSESQLQESAAANPEPPPETPPLETIELPPDALEPSRASEPLGSAGRTSLSPSSVEVEPEPARPGDPVVGPATEAEAEIELEIPVAEPADPPLSSEQREVLLRWQDTLEETIRELPRSREELENHNQKLRRKTESLAEQLSDRDAMLEDSDRERRDRLSERDRFERKIAQAEKEITNLQEQPPEPVPPPSSESSVLSRENLQPQAPAGAFSGQLEILQIELKTKESELQRLQEEMDRQRRVSNESERTFRRELAQYQEHYFAMKQSLADFEQRCSRLQQEKVELREKLAWFDAIRRDTGDQG